MATSKVMQVAYSYYALINSNADNKTFFCLLDHDYKSLAGAQEILNNIPVSENPIFGFLSPYSSGSAWVEGKEHLGNIHSFLVTERCLYIKHADDLLTKMLEDISHETVEALDMCLSLANNKIYEFGILEKICSELISAASSTSQSSF